MSTVYIAGSDRVRETAMDGEERERRVKQGGEKEASEGKKEER